MINALADFTVWLLFCISTMLLWMISSKKVAVTIALGCCIVLIVSCSNKPLTTDEESMSTIKLYNLFTFSIPASPGAEASTFSEIAGTLTAAGPAFGIEYPKNIAPSATPLTEGCSDNSNALVKRYRFTVLGAQGLRPGNSNALNGVGVNMGRKSSWYPAMSQNSLVFKFVGDQWEEVNEQLILVNGVTPQKTFAVNSFTTQLIIDTRNLQSVYYGTTVQMLLEVEVECVAELT